MIKQYALNTKIKNPRHNDLSYAKNSGYPNTPAQNSMVIYLTQKAIINNILEYNPARLKEFHSKVVNFVTPGKKIFIRGKWDIENSQSGFRLINILTCNENQSPILNDTKAMVI